ncbi:ABC transporter ATP-binding protein [Helcobacillus massiliensis]|uniref:ABC-2 type transport system ATP-binding protein n=1 Tax=Helcobacillus massiliensis TaxID=521392 RepID=A0A839QTI6_9MICO|nr:ATP-binding cassette domain-containing protein [Helcobacillus massiliensis]MBB3023382.1 ABC-2 type transport system ATP-binding protein [Helcobacillus massiliensis]
MITLTDINKTYGTHHVLRDVSFSIKPGLMTGFVGGNGAGKTTTMRIILGVLSHDSGEVTVNGERIDADFRARVGYMPEERGLYPKMKVLDQLVFLGQLHGMSASSARSSATDLLERLGLGERGGDTLESLSLGNQQRAQIAAALVHQPTALILDEPFSGLDPMAVDTTLEVLRDVAASGAPVLFSSHQLDVVERLCDELIIIASGQIAAAGTRDELLRAGAEPDWELRAGSDTGWVRDMPVTVREFDGGYVRFAARSLEDANAVLAEAQARGTVLSFGQRTPTLHEIFTEAMR